MKGIMKTFTKLTEKTNEDLYKDYIREHVSNVKKVWNDYRVMLMADQYINQRLINTLDVNILDHDKSKYSADEFYAYRQYFYPEPHESKNEEMFLIGWNSHQKSNRHHWEYWCLINNGKIVTLPMPYEYILEMLCDWGAMSIRFKNIPSKWYTENKSKMMLAPETKFIVESLIADFDKIVRKYF